MRTLPREQELRICLTAEEVDLLEQVAAYQGAEELGAWARQRLVTAAREIEAERPSAVRPHPSAINWKTLRRIALVPTDREDLSTPVKSIDRLLHRK